MYSRELFARHRIVSRNIEVFCLKPGEGFGVPQEKGAAY